MKTILLLISLLVGAFSVSAQTVEISKTSDEVIKVVDHICDKLQVPTEHVWETIVQAQPICFYECLAMFLIFFVLFIVFSKITINYWESECVSCVGGVLSVVTLIATTITLISTIGSIKCLLYPEYTAMLKIIETLQM